MSKNNTIPVVDSEEAQEPVIYRSYGNDYEVDELDDHKLMLCIYDLKSRIGFHANNIMKAHHSIATLDTTLQYAEQRAKKRGLEIGTPNEKVANG